MCFSSSSTFQIGIISPKRNCSILPNYFVREKNPILSIHDFQSSLHMICPTSLVGFTGLKRNYIVSMNYFIKQSCFCNEDPSPSFHSLSLFINIPGQNRKKYNKLFLTKFFCKIGLPLYNKASPSFP